MKNFIFQTFYIFLTFLIAKAKSDCTMQQECDSPTSPDCQPTPAVGELKKPRKNTVPASENLCPDYQDKMVCCSPLQIEKIKANFVAIESIFGSSIGGCDICVANLKRFWCHFTCHPQQSDFLEEFGITNHTIGNKTMSLLDLKFHLNEQMNCDLFKSCQKTKFAAQVPAMGNAVGFTTFQGVNAYTKIAVFIEIVIEKELGLKYDNDPCNTLSDKDGYIRGIKIDSNCTCNACSLMCDYKLESTTPILEGLNWLVVGLFYLFVIIATVVIYYVKEWDRKKNGDSKSRSSSGEFLNRRNKGLNVSVSSGQS